MNRMRNHFPKDRGKDEGFVSESMGRTFFSESRFRFYIGWDMRSFYADFFG
ncbi:hypothetical protein LEP1GSC130_3314 [Leptospira santarosai str. 200403458]|nr:hypothetical protein LEP1GSC130_3314 [Leptospira santarosai str. 200403458]